MSARRLGLDLGGSWLRGCLDGRKLEAPFIGPWRNLPGALKRLKLGRLDSITVGAKGVWSAADRAEMRRLLRPFARKVIALSDLELAHAAAFAGGPGVLLIAGTGSSAYAVDGRGKVRRAGGWGPLIGDDGSAFWLGRQALRDPKLRRKLRLDPLDFRGPDAVRKTAALAPRVLKASPSLRKAAAGHLSALVKEADPAGKLPVSWTGGLLNDPGLKRLLSRRLKLQDPAMAPECAAYLRP